MSRHVWLTKRAAPRAEARAREALAHATRVFDPASPIALAFAGYAAESIRQAGRHFRYISGEYRWVETSIPDLWEAAARRGFRFARGRNRDNYITAARVLLTPRGWDHV